MEKYLSHNVAKKLNDGRGDSDGDKPKVEKVENV